MKIVEKPYDLAQLRTLSKDGRDRVAAVVAVPWRWLLNHGQDGFEEELARRVAATRYGLAGCLNQDLLLEVGDDVSMLLGDYDLIMAEEAREVGDGQGA